MIFHFSTRLKVGIKDYRKAAVDSPALSLLFFAGFATRAVSMCRLLLRRKPLLPPRKKRKPGRGQGHERAMPAQIDQTVEVPVAARAGGGCRCPNCSGELGDFKNHERVVEDIVPAKVIATRYRTRSGFCRHCNKRVESRHADQPPAADLSHAQLGLSALTMAAVLKHDAGFRNRSASTRFVSV